MANVLDIPERGFRFIEGVFQYSAGIAALPGFRIARARFANPIPLHEGFSRIQAHLAALNLPATAFAACELRSPEPFSEQDFVTFNRGYFGVLEKWGVIIGGLNPVARSNVCPELDKPVGPSFHAFSYAVPANTSKAGGGALPSFVIAGSGESTEGKGSYRDHTIAWRDLSAAGMRAKIRHVMAEMERRMIALGFAWPDTTATQIYTVHDLFPYFAEEIVARGAARHGATWQFCRPPVVDLEFEVDCRGVMDEIVLPQ
ncbi:MAG: hypothetical protein IT555_15615 [Acetobacteraceae bacterium]|nr:hypothetical protein [Acetobacteraceae bacterium]